MLKKTKEYKSLAEMADIDGNLKYLKNINYVSNVEKELNLKQKNDHFRIKELN